MKGLSQKPGILPSPLKGMASIYRLKHSSFRRNIIYEHVQHNTRIYIYIPCWGLHRSSSQRRKRPDWLSHDHRGRTLFEIRRRICRRVHGGQGRAGEGIRDEMKIAIKPLSVVAASTQSTSNGQDVTIAFERHAKEQQIVDSVGTWGIIYCIM